LIDTHSAKMLFMYNREFKIEVRDSSFQPQIIVIEEGDRIWWEWTKDKVTALHNN